MSQLGDVEYPVIGEPIVLELANTNYRNIDEMIDFLASPTLVEGWFVASPTGSLITRPTRWNAATRAQLAGIRDAIYDVMNCLIDNRLPERQSITRLNVAAATSTPVPELRWIRNEGPSIRVRVATGPAIDSLLNDLAVRALELLTGPRAADVRRCASDDCWMLFLKDHPRRRWCHNSCGHRNRQASYYRRTHPQTPGSHSND